MGAKTAVKLRKRGAAYKCEVCGRKLMTPDALVIHQRTAHNITRRTKTKKVIKPVKTSKIHIKVKPVKKAPSPPKNPPKTKVKDVVKKEPIKKEEEQSEKKNTVEFECPKCFRVFLTYFPAHKHIQKYHCVNKQGTKVPPNSPNLIQPVRIELCLKCNRKVKSIQTHVCENAVKEKGDSQVFVCTACEEWFPNLKSFDIHVLSVHSDEVESMFFPTSTEFTKWKKEMETQTNVSYAILDKHDSKKYYHCNFFQENHEKNNTTYFCPSTIIIQEFSKGIQVHFYKEHYKHCFVKYLLSDKYKKYSITSFLKPSEAYNNLSILASDDNDLYLQFKTLMEGIVLNAAKINIPSLKILIGKALDMTSILTNYDEEIDDSNLSEDSKVNPTMNDSQITKALEDDDLNVGKRKSNGIEDEIDLKRPKIEQEDSDVTSSPKILNSFSLANKVDTMNKINLEDKKNKEQNVKPLKRMSELEQSPSSFNDSYKDFVVKNFPATDKEVRKRGRPVVKTKIGQYKPTLSPKSPVNLEPSKIDSYKYLKQLSIDKPKVDFEYEVKEQEGGCNILILKI